MYTPRSSGTRWSAAWSVVLETPESVYRGGEVALLSEALRVVVEHHLPDLRDRVLGVVERLLQRHLVLIHVGAVAECGHDDVLAVGKADDAGVVHDPDRVRDAAGLVRDAGPARQQTRETLIELLLRENSQHVISCNRVSRLPRYDLLEEL